MTVNLVISCPGAIKLDELTFDYNLTLQKEYIVDQFLFTLTFKKKTFIKKIDRHLNVRHFPPLRYSCVVVILHRKYSVRYNKTAYNQLDFSI